MAAQLSRRENAAAGPVANSRNRYGEEGCNLVRRQEVSSREA